MSKTRQVMDRAMGDVERRASSSTKRLENIMTRAGRTINTAIGGMLAGVSIQQVAKLADGYTKVQNSLKVAGLEGQALKTTYDELFAAAQRQGVPIAELSTLYGRLAMAQKDLRATAPELMRFTEGVATAIRVSGQSSAESAGALLQLSQAMGGGVIQAQEYNSLIDGARPVLQAVAAGLTEAGGSVSKLTALVKDGEVSSEAFFRAFLAGKDVLDAMAEKSAPTLAQGMTRVYNALTDAAGKMSEAIGATEGFQAAINALLADIGKMPAGLQASIHEMERFIQLFGQAKAMAREGLSSLGVVSPQNRIDQAFDADSYAVHGSMRGYKRPVNEEGSPLSITVKPRKTVSLADYPVTSAKDGKGGGKSSKEKIDDFQRETEAIQRRTRALDMERTTIGLSEGATAKAEASFRLLEAAKKANITVTPELKAQVEQLSAAYGEATQKVEDARSAQEAAVEAAREVGSALSSAFQDAILEGEKLDEVGRRLIKTFASKAIDNIFNSLFSSSGSGGLGGLLGGLFSTGKAMGGPVRAGVPVTVGESGRETFVPTTPGRIIPHGKGGGSPVQVNVINEAGVPTDVQSNDSGGVDVIIPLENALADRASRGKGSLYKASTGRAGGRTLRG